MPVQSTSFGATWEILGPVDQELLAPSDDPPRLEPLAPSDGSRSPYATEQGDRIDRIDHQIDHFTEVLAQIQELQERLREIHEAEVGRMDAKRHERPLKTTSLRGGKKHSSSGSKASKALSMPSPDPTESKGKLNKMASQLVEEAFLAKNDMDEEMRMETEAELELHVATEWDVDDEELMEMKKSDMNHNNTSGGPGQIEKYLLLPTMTLEYRDVATNWCVFHPESPRKVMWDCLAMIALLFDIAVGPVNVYNLDPTSERVFEVMHWVASCYWMLDIPVCFCTAVYLNDVLHFRHSVIAKAYLCSWFSFDVLMLIPDVMKLVHLDLLWAPDSSSAGMLRVIRMQRLVRVLRFLRLLRVDRLVPLRKRLELLLPIPTENLRVLLPIVKAALALGLGIHLLASLWYVVGSADQGWVCDEALHEAPFAEQYMRSVEWAVSRLPPSSLRNNVELATRAERWLAIVATFVALVSSSLLVGILTNALADLTQRRKKTQQILEAVRKYCGDSHLPFTYTMRVRRFVEREHCRHVMHGHMEFLQSLPEAMVSELFHEARSRQLSRSHPFLKEICNGNRSMELDMCMKAVTELYVLESDALFDSHQRAKGMYVLASGRFFYCSEKQGAICKVRFGSAGPRSVHPVNSFQSDEAQATVVLKADEHLSEQGLWIKGWRHCGRLEASSEHGKALLLCKSELHGVLREHADVFATTVVYARFFVDVVNSLPVVTDLSLEDTKAPSGNRAVTSWTLQNSAFKKVVTAA